MWLYITVKGVTSMPVLGQDQQDKMRTATVCINMILLNQKILRHTCKYIHAFLWKQSQKLFIMVTFGEMGLQESVREAVTFYSACFSGFISFFFSFWTFLCCLNSLTLFLQHLYILKMWIRLCDGEIMQALLTSFISIWERHLTRGWASRLQNQTSWTEIPACSLLPRWPWGKLFNVSVTEFPHL